MNDALISSLETIKREFLPINLPNLPSLPIKSLINRLNQPLSRNEISLIATQINKRLYDIPSLFSLLSFNVSHELLTNLSKLFPLIHQDNFIIWCNEIKHFDNLSCLISSHSNNYVEYLSIYSNQKDFITIRKLLIDELNWLNWNEIPVDLIKLNFVINQLKLDFVNLIDDSDENWLHLLSFPSQHHHQTINTRMIIYDKITSFITNYSEITSLKSPKLIIGLIMSLSKSPCDSLQSFIIQNYNSSIESDNWHKWFILLISTLSHKSHFELEDYFRQFFENQSIGHFIQFIHLLPIPIISSLLYTLRKTNQDGNFKVALEKRLIKYGFDPHDVIQRPFGTTFLPKQWNTLVNQWKIEVENTGNLPKIIKDRFLLQKRYFYKIFQFLIWNGDEYHNLIEILIKNGLINGELLQEYQSRNCEIIIPEKTDQVVQQEDYLFKLLKPNHDGISNFISLKHDIDTYLNSLTHDIQNQITTFFLKCISFPPCEEVMFALHCLKWYIVKQWSMGMLFDINWFKQCIDGKNVPWIWEIFEFEWLYHGGNLSIFKSKENVRFDLIKNVELWNIDLQLVNSIPNILDILNFDYDRIIIILNHSSDENVEIILKEIMKKLSFYGMFQNDEKNVKIFLHLFKIHSKMVMKSIYSYPSFSIVLFGILLSFPRDFWKCMENNWINVKLLFDSWFWILDKCDKNLDIEYGKYLHCSSRIIIIISKFFNSQFPRQQNRFHSIKEKELFLLKRFIDDVNVEIVKFVLECINGLIVAENGIVINGFENEDFGFLLEEFVKDIKE